MMAVNRYYESNIPIEYWSLKMERDFHGDPRLLAKYTDYVADLKSRYMTGSSLCLAGKHGSGKTFTLTSILKRAVQKGYTGLYTTLSDVVNILTSNSNYGEDRTNARRELVMVDFLICDEFDIRFIASDNAADLYARSLETVFRARSQNKLPTLMATNSPNPVESFNGPLKASIESLVEGYLEVFTVFPGKDFRKEKQ